jgi:hypothetical protein
MPEETQLAVPTVPFLQIPAYLRNNGYNKASNPEMKKDGGIPHNFADRPKKPALIKSNNRSESKM